MASEVWLRTNTRALWFGMVLPTAMCVVGAVLIVGLPGREPATWMRAVGAVSLLLGLWLIAALAIQLRRPRLAYRDGYLQVWLRAGRPIEVPIEVVECFWLGQAPSLLPGKRHERTETASIVIRIADHATEWRHQEVKPQLGSWCEGYVTIRGTWCEPLSIPLVNRLNERLANITRAATR
jgi:hypothetical protein